MEGPGGGVRGGRGGAARGGMSSVYELEPPTRGRVQLRTCAGPLDVELWPREAPRACRNFVQLCLEGYYDGAPFHRVVKEFLVQGGDPTGTGRGGASAFAGEPFADEFHTRLQFRRRGLVACAGAGAPDSNGSQFFVTLGRCDHLNKKHTIFGSVTGDSLYNLLRLGERETDADDRPVDPPRILGASVLENPFDDVAPRPRAEQVGRPPPAEEGAAGGGGEAARKGRGASKRPKAKDKLPSRLRMSMLSFGDDEEYEGYEEQAHAGGTAEAAREPPAGEAAVKAPENEGAVGPPPRGAVSDGGASRGPEKPPGAPAAAGDFGARMRAQVLEKRRRAEGTRGAGGGASAGGAGGAEPTAAGRSGAGPAGGGGGELGGRGVGQSLLRLKRPGGPPANEQKSLPEGGPPRKRRTGHGKREDGVIARLERAGRGGRAGGSGSAAPPAEPGGAGPRADRMDLPAAWRVDDYLDMEDEAGGGGGDDSAAGLRSHVLTFAERPRRPGEPRAGGDDWDDYEVIDPLLEKGKEAWERRQGAGGRRGEGRGAGGPSGGDRRRRSHRGSGCEPGADRGHRRGGGREDSGRRRRR